MIDLCYKVYVQLEDEIFHESYFATLTQLKSYNLELMMRCILNAKFYYKAGSAWQQFLLVNDHVFTRLLLEKLLLTLSAEA